MRPLLIVGCGGLGLEVLSMAKDCTKLFVQSEGSVEDVELIVVGFYDDGEPRKVDADRVYGNKLQYFHNMNAVPEDALFVVAVGDPVTRHKLFGQFISAGLQPVTLIHRSAVVDNTATIGQGCILCPNTFVGPFAAIGQNSIINNYSSVAHDAKIGCSCVLHPYATLSGFATVGSYSLLATRATVLVSTNMGAFSKLSAGSILNTDTKDGSLAVGNPAKHRVMFRDPTENSS